MSEYDIEPTPKPRMTQRDKWKKRPAVLRYHAFKDEVKLKGVSVPESGASVSFYMPMPKTWSKKKKASLVGEPHQQEPDVDNLLKALLDAVYDDDSGVWDIRASKIWSYQGKIVVDRSLTE